MIVRFEFHGGCKDGQIVEGPNLPGHLAENYMFLTDAGRLGARFREYPPDPELDALREEVSEWFARNSRHLPEFADPSEEPIDLARRIFAMALATQLLNELEPLVCFNGEVMSREEAERLVRQTQDRLRDRKAQVYEVMQRESRENGLLVQLEYLGDDETVRLEGP